MGDVFSTKTAGGPQTDPKLIEPKRISNAFTPKGATLFLRNEFKLFARIV